MKSFSFTIIFTTILILSSVAAINWRMMNPPFENFLNEASEWQLRTHGVVQTGRYTREFKYFMAEKRRDQIQTLIVGSSQIFGLRGNDDTFYNLASEGNGTACMAQEALEAVKKIPNLKKIIFSVDLFREFRTDPPTKCPLPVSFAAKTIQRNAPKFQISSVISWDITTVSFEFLKNRLNSPTPLHNFWAAAEYPCPTENLLGKDMFFLMPGKCFGFRYDGSSTFAYLPKDIDLKTIANFLPAENSTSYSFNPEILRHLVKELNSFFKRGGEIIFILPPIFPGFEDMISQLPKTGATYESAKQKFLSLLPEHPKSRVVDAMASEKFGCSEAMFLDVTHALSECFEKIKLF